MPLPINHSASVLITNQTGKDQLGTRNVDLLLAQGVQVTKIFAPEHGYSGIVGAEKEVKDGKDRATGIHIVSLYGPGTGRAHQQRSFR